jgi:hypothetical protein
MQGHTCSIKLNQEVIKTCACYKFLTVNFYYYHTQFSKGMATFFVHIKDKSKRIFVVQCYKGPEFQKTLHTVRKESKQYVAQIRSISNIYSNLNVPGAEF